MRLLALGLEHATWGDAALAVQRAQGQVPGLGHCAGPLALPWSAKGHLHDQRVSEERAQVLAHLQQMERAGLPQV